MNVPVGHKPGGGGQRGHTPYRVCPPVPPREWGFLKMSLIFKGGMELE